MEPKSLQNRFQRGFGRALNEDSVSKLKKVRARSVEGVATELKHEDSGSSGEGRKGDHSDF